MLFEEHFYNRLKALGFTADKSYCNDLILWNNIPDIFKKDFIRGLWDGDGYVSISADNKNLAGIISNNEQLLQTICDFFNEKLNITNCHITKSDGYPRIRLASKIARNAMKLLYKDSNVALDRKYNAYLKWKPSIYDKQYKYLKQLPSGRYYIYIPLNKKKTTVGTFDTIRECIEAFNKVAIENNIPTQKYIDENLVKEKD